MAKHKPSAVKVIQLTIRDNRERPPAYTSLDMAKDVVTALDREGFEIVRKR